MKVIAKDKDSVCVHLYFEDLCREAQEELKKVLHFSDPEEKNLDVFPLAVAEFSPPAWFHPD
jgi:hypothetical protein